MLLALSLSLLPEPLQYLYYIKRTLQEYSSYQFLRTRRSHFSQWLTIPCMIVAMCKSFFCNKKEKKKKTKTNGVIFVTLSYNRNMFLDTGIISYLTNLTSNLICIFIFLLTIPYIFFSGLRTSFTIEYGKLIRKYLQLGRETNVFVVCPYCARCVPDELRLQTHLRLMHNIEFWLFIV